MSRSTSASRRVMVASSWSTWFQVHAQQHSVVLGVKAPHQRLAQLADLGPHPGQRHVGQHLGVSLAGDDRLEHAPGSLAQNVGGPGVHLIPASSSSFWMRGVSRARSWTGFVR
jgi:hypothetical protein